MPLLRNAYHLYFTKTYTVYIGSNLDKKEIAPLTKIKFETSIYNFHGAGLGTIGIYFKFTLE